MELKSKTNVAKTIEIELTDKDILDMIIKAGYADLDKKKARVYFDVPSGGDYSGMRLDIDKEDTIKVIYEVKYTEK